MPLYQITWPKSAAAPARPQGEISGPNTTNIHTEDVPGGYFHPQPDHSSTKIRKKNMAMVCHGHVMVLFELGFFQLDIPGSLGGIILQLFDLGHDPVINAITVSIQLRCEALPTKSPVLTADRTSHFWGSGLAARLVGAVGAEGEAFGHAGGQRIVAALHLPGS